MPENSKRISRIQTVKVLVLFATILVGAICARFQPELGLVMVFAGLLLPDCVGSWMEASDARRSEQRLEE